MVLSIKVNDDELGMKSNDNDLEGIGAVASIFTEKSFTNQAWPTCLIYLFNCDVGVVVTTEYVSKPPQFALSWQHFLFHVSYW